MQIFDDVELTITIINQNQNIDQQTFLVLL